MGNSTKETLTDQFTVNADTGAELGRQQQAEVLSQKQRNNANMAIGQQRARFIRQAVRSLSKIQGVRASFSPLYDLKYNHVSAHIAVKGCRYNVSFGYGGDLISVDRAWGKGASAIPFNYIKDGKTPADTLQSIAMIVAYHYPDKKAEIDKVISEAIDKSQKPDPAQQRHQRTDKLQRNLTKAIGKAQTFSILA
jgi:hypothetical protein